MSSSLHSLEQTNIHRRNKMMTNSELWQSRTTKQLRDRDEQFPNVRIITTTKRNKKRKEPNLVSVLCFFILVKAD